MKRLFVILMVLVAARCTIAAAVEIEDIDKSHWAYEKVQRLVKEGYLALYEDNTFRGDRAVSRVIFAAALGKLIDQIESGEVRMQGVDIKAVKKLSDEFKTEIADYDTRVAALEKRLADIESGKVVIQQDISKVTLEVRDSVEKLEEDNAKLREDLDILSDQMNVLTDEFKKSEAQNKRTHTLMFIGILAAIAVGVASN
ncbi:MAG: S-layer homology domain-containing protein [bacterium]